MNDRAWGTESELAYIATIGTHSEQTRGLPRRTMLEHYFQAMQRRVEWKALDRRKILRAIFNALQEAANAP